VAGCTSGKEFLIHNVANHMTDKNMRLLNTGTALALGNIEQKIYFSDHLTSFAAILEDL
jgi:hypothetical protein